MHSTVDPKVSETPFSKDCSQQHKVKLEARHQWFDTGTHTVQWFLYNLEDGTECAVSKSANVKKLAGITDTQHGCAGPGQAGETGKEQRHEVQWREMPSFAPGEKQPPAPVYAGGEMAEKQLCKKD